MDKSKIKINLITGTYCIILFLILTNLSKLSNNLGNFIAIFTPFIYGFIIAYLLKNPFKFFETKVFAFKKAPKGSFLDSIRKPASMICVFLSLFLFIFVVFSVVVPQLVFSVNSLITSLPDYYKTLETFVTNLLESFNIQGEFWGLFENLWNDLYQAMEKLITIGFPRLLDILKGISSSVSNIILGFIVSIYMLYNKDKLTLQLKKFFIAFIPEKFVKKTFRVGALSNKIVSEFIVGQLTEAFILGILCFIGMSIFRFPYALLVSVIIGLTNIIPFFGPIIGAIPCTFIIIIANPSRAIWFIVFIIALQQIDNHVTAPRVVGNSVGLSGLWVIFGILVGGGLFGLPGMILGVPAFAIIYSLVREATYEKLNEKSLDITDEFHFD